MCTSRSWSRCLPASLAQRPGSCRPASLAQRPGSCRPASFASTQAAAGQPPWPAPRQLPPPAVPQPACALARAADGRHPHVSKPPPTHPQALSLPCPAADGPCPAWAAGAGQVPAGRGGHVLRRRQPVGRPPGLLQPQPAGAQQLHRVCRKVSGARNPSPRWRGARSPSPRWALSPGERRQLGAAGAPYPGTQRELCGCTGSFCGGWQRRCALVGCSCGVLDPMRVRAP